jgi:two-component system chemotaxis response regulator CheY
MSLRILAVDDSFTMRELLRHTLATAGFEVEVAEDGIERLPAKPGVIITDINMPRMGGFGFI